MEYILQYLMFGEPTDFVQIWHHLGKKDRLSLLSTCKYYRQIYEICNPFAQDGPCKSDTLDIKVINTKYNKIKSILCDKFTKKYHCDKLCGIINSTKIYNSTFYDYTLGYYADIKHDNGIVDSDNDINVFRIEESDIVSQESIRLVNHGVTGGRIYLPSMYPPIYLTYVEPYSAHNVQIIGGNNVVIDRSNVSSYGNRLIVYNTHKDNIICVGQNNKLEVKSYSYLGNIQIVGSNNIIVVNDYVVCKHINIVGSNLKIVFGGFVKKYENINIADSNKFIQL